MSNMGDMSNWQAYGETLRSRLLLGTARYPSPAIMAEAVAASGAEVLTLALRRQSPEQLGGDSIWQHITALGCRLLPNTAGCHSAKEAVTLALMSREIFDTDWLKLEVTGDDYNLQPDPLELLERHPPAGGAWLQGVRIQHGRSGDLHAPARPWL